MLELDLIENFHSIFNEEYIVGVKGARKLAAVSAGIALILGISGCQGDPGSASGDVELRFAWWGNTERVTMTQEAIDSFEAKNPGITVRQEYTDYGSYFDRLATNVAGGDAPDVITLAGAYTREYADRGALLDLGEVSSELDTSAFPETVLGAAQSDGSQFGVPTGVNTLAVILNPRIFAEAGVPLPDEDSWSWEDYAEISNAIAAKSPDGTYGTIDLTNVDVLELYARQRGESTYNDDGKINVKPATLESWWNMTNGLSKSGGAPSASTTIELAGQPGIEQSLMGRGRAGMQVTWTNQFGAFQKAANEPLKMIRVPGETQKELGTWLQAGQVYTIGSRSKHPVESAKLIDFLVNDPEAAKSIKTDRGVPANPKVLEAIQPELTEVQKEETEFVGRMSALSGPPRITGPVGSTATQLTLDRLNGDVLFDRLSPGKAAEEFVGQVSAAISK